MNRRELLDHISNAACVIAFILQIAFLIVIPVGILIIALSRKTIFGAIIWTFIDLCIVALECEFAEPVAMATEKALHKWFKKINSTHPIKFMKQHIHNTRK